MYVSLTKGKQLFYQNRALYLGHLRIAVLLVQHKDINLMIEASAEPSHQRKPNINPVGLVSDMNVLTIRSAQIGMLL